MKNIVDFLSKIGTLKDKPRRGWMIHEIEDAETTSDHTYHLVLLVWLLGNKKDINIERAMKIALVHDMCEVYGPDLTSADAAGLKEEGEITREELENSTPILKRPTPNQRKKMQKIKEELEVEGMNKLLENSNKDIKEEVWSLWNEYKKALTPEGKFVKQADKMVNVFQGMEYCREGKIEKEVYKLWIERAKESIDDSHLLEFLKEVEVKLNE